MKAVWIAMGLTALIAGAARRLPGRGYATAKDYK